MASLNKVMIIGNLGGGSRSCGLRRMARQWPTFESHVAARTPTREGQRQEVTEWVRRLSAWQRLGGVVRSVPQQRPASLCGGSLADSARGRTEKATRATRLRSWRTMSSFLAGAVAATSAVAMAATGMMVPAATFGGGPDAGDLPFE